MLPGRVPQEERCDPQGASSLPSRWGSTVYDRFEVVAPTEFCARAFFVGDCVLGESEPKKWRAVMLTFSVALQVVSRRKYLLVLSAIHSSNRVEEF